MTQGNPELVFAILVPVLLAVGVYLLWYSRRRNELMKAFASSHGLAVHAELAAGLEERLTRLFDFDRTMMVRSFGQLKNIVKDGDILIFNGVELLSLTPLTRSNNTHFSRIAALFPISGKHSGFFDVDKSGAIISRVPGEIRPDENTAQIVKRTVAEAGARHSLSATFKGGYGLIYFEPLVTGGENIADLDCLLRLTRLLKSALGSKADLLLYARLTGMK